MKKLFYYRDDSHGEPVVSVTYANSKADAARRFREELGHYDIDRIHHVRFEHGDVCVLTDY